MDKTVIILPETDQTTLCLRLTGMITRDEYRNNFDLPLRAMVAAHGFLNLCVIYDKKFEGWTPEAGDLSFKNLSDLGPNARRVAYVNAPDSRLLLMKMMDPVMKAEIRYFDLSEESTALAWIKS